MWLSKQINNNKKSEQVSIGKVTLSNNNTVNVRSNTEYKNIPIVLPYGMACRVPLGEFMYILPTDNGNVAIGTYNNNDILQDGELMLYSKGGAKIILKNNGSVIINDTVIKACE